MKPVEFHRSAMKEAHAAARHYEKIRLGLGVQFRVALSHLIDRVSQNPQLYAAEANGARVGVLKRFPYIVVYKDLDDRVWVAAVVHQSRRPGYWTRRRSG